MADAEAEVEGPVAAGSVNGRSTHGGAAAPGRREATDDRGDRDRERRARLAARAQLLPRPPRRRGSKRTAISSSSSGLLPRDAGTAVNPGSARSCSKTARARRGWTRARQASATRCRRRRPRSPRRTPPTARCGRRSDLPRGGRPWLYLYAVARGRIMSTCSVAPRRRPRGTEGRAGPRGASRAPRSTGRCAPTRSSRSPWPRDEAVLVGAFQRARAAGAPRASRSGGPRCAWAPAPCTSRSPWPTRRAWSRATRSASSTATSGRCCARSRGRAARAAPLLRPRLDQRRAPARRLGRLRPRRGDAPHPRRGLRGRAHALRPDRARRLPRQGAGDAGGPRRAPVDEGRLVRAIAEAYAAGAEVLHVDEPELAPSGGDTPPEPPWAAVVEEAIGIVGAGHDARGVFRVGGDLLVSRDALARLEARRGERCRRRRRLASSTRRSPLPVSPSKACARSRACATSSSRHVAPDRDPRVRSATVSLDSLPMSPRLASIACALVVLAVCAPANADDDTAIARYRKIWNPFSAGPELVSSADVHPQGQLFLRPYIYSELAYAQYGDWSVSNTGLGAEALRDRPAGGVLLRHPRLDGVRDVRARDVVVGDIGRRRRREQRQRPRGHHRLPEGTVPPAATG